MTTQTITNEQAAKIQQAVNARHDIPNLPALLPVMEVAHKPGENGKPGRYLVRAQGFTLPILVWENHALAMREALATAPITAAGFPLLPVTITATSNTTPERKVDGVTLPERTFYNVSAAPFKAQAIADMFA